MEQDVRSGTLPRGQDKVGTYLSGSRNPEVVRNRLKSYGGRRRACKARFKTIKREIDRKDRYWKRLTFYKSSKIT